VRVEESRRRKVRKVRKEVSRRSVSYSVKRQVSSEECVIVRSGNVHMCVIVVVIR
jgi:hypothetical protein